MEDLFQRPEILLRIQSLLNNISSSTTKKTPNKVVYRFSPKRLLDLCLTATLPNTYVTYTNIANTIFFTFANYNKHYNKSH